LTVNIIIILYNLYSPSRCGNL